MGEENTELPLPDTIDENVARRKIVKKTIEHGEAEVTKWKAYDRRLESDYNNRLVPADRIRKQQEADGA